MIPYSFIFRILTIIVSIINNPKTFSTMKRFLIAACVAAMAFLASSCYQSVVTPLGDDLASFTKRIDKATEYVGVKNTANDVVLVEPVYEVVYYKADYIIAAKQNKFAIFERTGQRVFEDLQINEVSAGKNYFIFGVQGRGKYFFIPHKELCGPAANFTYYPGSFLLFAQNNGGSYGVYDPETGQVVLEQKYPQLTYAIDEKGNTAFYVGGKVTKKLVDGKERSVTTANLNLMKKEATTNKTPWPKDGVGVVKVKVLR